MRIFVALALYFVVAAVVVVAGADEESGPENDGTVEISGPFDELPMDQRSAAKKLAESFEEIDKLLSAKTDSFDLDLNIRLADEILKSKSKMSNLLSAGSKIKQALKLFVALPEAAKSCNFNGYEVLAKNSMANKGHLYGSRTRTVLDNYANIHASNCLDDFEKNLENTMIQVDKQDNVALVNEILFGLNASDVLIQSGSGKKSKANQLRRTELITSSVGSFKIQDSGVAKILNNIEPLLMKGGPDEDAFYAIRDGQGKFHAPEQFGSRILAKFLIEPCQQYVNNFKGFFASARLDLHTYKQRQLLVPSMNEEETSSLVLDAWTKHRICLSLIRADLKMIQPKFERIIVHKIGLKPPR